MVCVAFHLVQRKGFKMARLKKGEVSLQSVVNDILDKSGEMKGKELVAVIQKSRPNSKEGSILQALNIWRKNHGLVKPRASKMVAKPGVPSLTELLAAKSVIDSHFNGKPDKLVSLLDELSQIGDFALVRRAVDGLAKLS